MANTSLRLIPEVDQHADSLMFERRRSIRRRMRGSVTALVSSPRDYSTAPGRKICAMALSDMSEEGLGVVSQENVDVGDEITVFFPPHGPDRGFDLKGTVVRQSNRSHGNCLGIRFGRQIMAA